MPVISAQPSLRSASPNAATQQASPTPASASKLRDLFVGEAHPAYEQLKPFQPFGPQHPGSEPRVVGELHAMAARVNDAFRTGDTARLSEALREGRALLVRTRLTCGHLPCWTQLSASVRGAERGIRILPTHPELDAGAF